MMRLAILLAASALFSLPASAQQTAAEDPSAVNIRPGILVPKVVAKADPSQSYALYLPANYSLEKQWPVVFAFDPAARGSLPVELLRDGAERYGYVVAGSNNSRNGSAKIELAATNAMLADVRSRFSVDDRRIYFAGFSGGARLAAQIAQNCDCAAGVLLNGAGFSPKPASSVEKTFAVYAATGTYDFNYPEIFRMDEQLEKVSNPHFLRRFDGPHQWAPADSMSEALGWFQLQAMKSGRQPHDNSVIQELLQQGTERAQKFEQSENPYSAWNEYRQVASAFDGLTDVTALRSRSQSLEKEKLVRDGAKREHQDFDDQSRLESDISSDLFSLAAGGGQLAELRGATEQKITGLRTRTEHEKQEEKRRVLKRALSGIFVQAMEAGSQHLEFKQYDVARAYFELAAVADPSSLWVLQNLAITRAFIGDRKGTCEVLRRAKLATKDSSAFINWLKTEPAFDKLRNSEEFRALL